MEATKACCDRDRPPSGTIIVSGVYTPIIAWHWGDRSVPRGLLMLYYRDEWHFTTYRKLRSGPGRIGETFVETGSFSGNALDRFFSKMDRMKKEEEECDS